MKKKLSEFLLSVLSFGRFKASGNDKQKQLLKKDFDMSSISFNDETVVYDGHEHEITITGALPKGVSVKYENNAHNNAGIYEAVAILSGEDYNTLKLTATLAINKADFNMSCISFNDKTVRYDGNEHDITITGTLPEGVSVSYKNNKLTDAGAIIASAVFSHNNQNYNEIPNMVATLTIKKSYRVSYIVENKVVHFENLNLGDSYTLYEYVTEKYDVVAWIYDGKEISPNTQMTLIEEKDIIYIGKISQISNDFEFEEAYHDGEAIITRYKGNNTSVVIPEYIKENNQYYKVRAISFGAFLNCSSLTKVTIPNSVETIGNDTFNGCSSLTSITIPNSVGFICERAFKGCSSLTSITIPNSVQFIGDDAFSECKSLTSITIPNSVKTICCNAFFYCECLTSITIPNNVKYIGDFTFCGCESLTNITIPNSVTIIGANAFDGCESLTCITIPNSVKTIDCEAFNECSSLTSITIPNSVTSIEYRTFNECSSLKNITIPNSVTSIDEDAFWNCKRLKNVYYKGNRTEWNSISGRSYIGGTKYFYSETKPASKGNYWHYENGKPVIWN